jgi:Cd2+/Zn2+-exporting ATPase
MLVAEQNSVRGFVALADAPRHSSQHVIRELSELGITTVMLTGDNGRVANRVGNEIGVTEVRAELMPQDKVREVQRLTETYTRVAMVGDGVNDTPALAAATIGVAMGGAGSPQALETADVVLMADDLTQLPFAVKLSRFARLLITQNVVLSFGLKGVFLLLALMGMTSLWVAIFADVGMSLLVTLNGMRPLRFGNKVLDRQPKAR